MKTPLPLRPVFFGLAALALVSIAPQSSAQGCMQIRFMAHGLGADGITLLNPGESALAFSFRYLYADEGWRGTERWPGYETAIGNQITIRSVDLQLTHAFTRRFSATLSLPYVSGQTENSVDHDRVTRHVVRARGFGDIRVVGNYWLFDESPERKGNISLGLGLKAPTGNDAATGRFYRTTGTEVRPVDTSIQPGDGGWGVVFEAAAFRKVAGPVFAYANGYYLVNPRETNSAYTTQADPAAVLPVSVPDQYQARVGLSATVWRAGGLTLSAGARVNGMPARDLVGGNEGFRRPGYVVYFEPGLMWTNGRHTVSALVPVRLDAKRTRNVYDRVANQDGGGAFARRLFMVSYARTF